MHTSKAVFHSSFPLRIWHRLGTEKIVLLLIFLIPFQYRLYKLLRPISMALIDLRWQLPRYFEVHLDLFISDFILLFLFYWWARKESIPWKPFFLEGERKYLTLFLLFSLASIVNSAYATYGLHYWRWMHLVLPAFLFFIVSRLTIEEQRFVKIARVVLAACLIECAIAIPQYLLQHSLGLKGLGEPTLIAAHFKGANFPMADGSVWILDALFNIVRQRDFVLRAYGTLPHPNILGGFMVFGLLMTYYLYGVGKRRGWLGLAMMVQVFCLFITYSRSALYAWGLATVLWIFWTYRREKKLSSLCGVVLGSFLLCLALLYPQIFERGGIVSYHALAQNADMTRLHLAERGMAMLLAHPFFGIGFNNYMLVLQTFAQGHSIEADYIHNVYLHLGVEVGLLGLLPFLMFCFAVLKKGYNHRQRPEVMTALCIFIALLSIGLVDFYPLCSQQMRLVFFLMAAVIIGCSHSRAIPR